MTPAEQERAAYLRNDPQQSLYTRYADAHRMINAVSSVDNDLMEAQGCFIHEDFLNSELRSLRSLLMRVRGDNKTSLAGLIDNIEFAVQQQAGTSEHGNELINTVRGVLDRVII